MLAGVGTVKLTRADLERLAHEMHDTAAGVKTIADALEETGTASVWYPDHSLTVRLAVLLDVVKA